MTAPTIPEPLHDCPLAPRLVYATLRAQGPLPLDALPQHTGLAYDTARQAVATLQDHDAATKRPAATDGRRVRVAARDPSP